MPVYDFICERCKFTFIDKFIKSSESYLECPECTTIMKRKIPTPNIHLKGGRGIYGKSYDTSKMKPEAVLNQLDEREAELGIESKKSS